MAGSDTVRASRRCPTRPTRRAARAISASGTVTPARPSKCLVNSSGSIASPQLKDSANCIRVGPMAASPSPMQGSLKGQTAMFYEDFARFCADCVTLAPRTVHHVVMRTPERTTTMFEERPTVVCAWCSRLLESGGTLISHGICKACMVALIAEHRPMGGGRAHRRQRRLGHLAAL